LKLAVVVVCGMNGSIGSRIVEDGRGIDEGKSKIDLYKVVSRSDLTKEEADADLRRRK
jgi:hypothetical protein